MHVTTLLRSVAVSAVVLLATTSFAQSGDIHLAWDANPLAQNVLGYKVYVGTVPGAPTEVFFVTGGSTTLTYTPSNPTLVHFFAVSALNANGEGPKSIEVATAPRFTDPVLSAGTTIRIAHIVELRAAIDVIRLAAGLAVFPWTDPTLTAGVTVMKVAHVAELQTAIVAVYTQRGTSPPSLTPIAAGTWISATHVSEIRIAVVNAL